MADNRSCEDKTLSAGTITVDIDCEDALKGLKAVQREARRATKELKDLDKTIKHQCPECKAISLNIESLYAGEEVQSKERICSHCGYEDVISNE